MTAIGLSILPHNDVHLDATNNLAMVTGVHAVGQHVRQRLKFWRGETSWFLGEDVGVEWTRYVLGRPPQEQSIAEAVIKSEVMATPGVTAITEFDARYDRPSRGLLIDRLAVETIYDDLGEFTVLPTPPELTPEAPVEPPPPVETVLSLDFSNADNSQYLTI